MKKDIIDKFLLIGGCMANLCFNGQQQPMLSESMRKTMRQLYQDWDRVRAEYRTFQEQRRKKRV